MLSLDEIVDLLDQHGQRATYGAVAKVVGHAPRSLLKGRDRGRRYSWIVNRDTGLPTGYQEDQIDPRLRESGRVLNSDVELRAWLESHSGAEVGAET
jgi:alkylated DNA nucleotide flippase Atl1